MRGYKVAGRYAQSLLELAEERNSTDSIVKDMENLVSATNESRDFHVFLNSPIINSTKKNSILDKVFGDFQELSMSFIHLITKNRREMLLPLIAEEYLAKVKAMRGIVPVSITSAVTLDAKVKEFILAKLNKGIDGKIELDEKIDADLIGGFVVRMGDTRIDASVSNQLRELKQRLTR
jgi:F-type H+-transporting ATPase subunit delta